MLVLREIDKPVYIGFKGRMHCILRSQYLVWPELKYSDISNFELCNRYDIRYLEKS